MRVIAFDLAECLCADPSPWRDWPSSAAARRALDDAEVSASPAELRAAIDYVLRWDTPRSRLRTLREASEQLAFRLSAKPARKAHSALARLLATCPALEPAEGALEAVALAKERKLRAAAISAWPVYLPLDALRAVLRALDVHVTAAEIGVSFGTPAFYGRVMERVGCRPEELFVVGPDPVCHVEAVRAAKARGLLLAGDAASAPRVRQLATVTGLAEAVAAVAAAGK